MEVVALGGLLAAAFVVSKFSRKQHKTPEEIMYQAQAQVSEGFLPAQRGPDRQALTQTPKGASAVGFGPNST